MVEVFAIKIAHQRFSPNRTIVSFSTGRVSFWIVSTLFTPVPKVKIPSGCTITSSVAPIKTPYAAISQLSEIKSSPSRNVMYSPRAFCAKKLRDGPGSPKLFSKISTLGLSLYLWK